MSRSRRYTFDEVRRALHAHWGLALSRGSVVDPDRDGRWDKSYSRTGYVISGHIPGHGHGAIHYRSLAQLVRTADLADVIARCRRIRAGRA